MIDVAVHTVINMHLRFLRYYFQFHCDFDFTYSLLIYCIHGNIRCMLFSPLLPQTPMSEF